MDTEMDAKEGGLLNPAVTVLGIGNLLLTDDGFGVHVLRRLESAYSFPATVQLLDGGTLGLELSFFLADTKRLLIIDALKGDDPPGTLVSLSGKALECHLTQKLSAHEIGLRDILHAARLGGNFPETHLIGAVKGSLEAGLNLSPPLREAVDPCIDMILEQLARWGITRKV